MTKTQKQPSLKKVVVIGGGTGTYQVLLGLKKHPHLDLTAIVNMSDSGGSSGKLRKELGILPPGDLRRALLALSDLPLSKKTLEKLFEFRFRNGKLQGHSFGNLLLAALIEITGRMDLAVSEASHILEVTGHVLPVTLDNTELHARLANGKTITGEAAIDKRGKTEKPLTPIKQVFLKPHGKIFTPAAAAIRNADLLVLGPGDLYTSLIPNLLIKGVNEEIAKSKAPLIFIINLMTKHGETDDYQASDFVREAQLYLGLAKHKLAGIIINKSLNTPLEILAWYKKFHALPVFNDLNKSQNFKIIEKPVAEPGAKFIRHHPDKLAAEILKLLH